MVKVRVDNESKEEKFKRIAGKRANKILESIRLLGNCANKQVYDYSDSQVNHLFSVIEEELKHTKTQFKRKRERKVNL